MIDKLEVTIKSWDDLQPAVRAALNRAKAGRLGWKTKDGYVLTPEFPVEVRLHRDEPYIKTVATIGLRDVAEMSADEITDALAEVSEGYQALRISRLDLAVDVPDLSVPWFQQNVLVANVKNRKQWAKPEFGVQKGIEQVRWGAVNSARHYVAYDKLAEQAAKGAPPRIEYAGAGIVTRVEARYRRDGLPASMRTWPGIEKNVRGFQPFPPATFVMRPALLTPESLGRLHSLTWSAQRDAFLLWALVERHGVNGAMSWIRASGGDPAKFKDLLPMLPAQGAKKLVDLNGLFAASVTAQLDGLSITIHGARKFIRSILSPIGHDQWDDRSGLAQMAMRFATEIYPQFQPAPETVRTHRCRSARKPPGREVVPIKEPVSNAPQAI
jgi:hypothetical protein